MKNNIFLIIDGSSMLSTAYYGNLPKQLMFAKTEEEKEKLYSKILQTSDGRYTNALLTMLRTLYGIYKKVNPTYVAFVFDQSRNTFRRTELGADFYKANRKSTPSPLKEQFVAMEKILEDIGCKVLYSETYEADDFAASLVDKFECPDLRTIVLTKDHDYFQLVSDYTRMWRPVNKDKLIELQQMYGLYAGETGYDSLPSNVFEYTSDIVLAEEGVTPDKIVDLLSIQGDPGDGIPGCKGVASAAVPLINEYGSIEGIYEAIEACNGEKKAEKELTTFWKESLEIKRSPLNALKEYKEDVLLSHKLASMKRDIELTEELADFELNINKDALVKVLDDYEMVSLKKDFGLI